MNLDIRFDFQRRERIGLIEAIWGADKSIGELKRMKVTDINDKKASNLMSIQNKIENSDTENIWCYSGLETVQKNFHFIVLTGLNLIKKKYNNI